MTAQPMTAQSAQAIHVQRLEKSYKKLRALRGVDFDVARGSIFAPLEPSRAKMLPRATSKSTPRSARSFLYDIGRRYA